MIAEMLGAARKAILGHQGGRFHDLPSGLSS
jgi:hypothetical protein